MDTSGLTFNQTILAISEFIEVAIHTILYVRQIYPVDLFVRRKKYDTPVYQSRHPLLNEYISGAVKAISQEIIKGNMDKVIVVIKDKTETPLERFIFSVRQMIQIESYSKNDSVQGAMTPQTLGKYFRSFLVKLSMIESQLGLLDAGEDVSFAILIELKDNMEPTWTSTKGDPPPWIPAVEQHTTAGASDEAELHMIRAVETGIISLSLAVQESEEKLRRRDEAENLD